MWHPGCLTTGDSSLKLADQACRACQEKNCSSWQLCISQYYHITQSAQDKCMDRYKTSVWILFITFKNRLSHDITTAMYNSVLTHITMSAQDRCVDRYKTSTVC